jgi:hypothetical protein
MALGTYTADALTIILQGSIDEQYFERAGGLLGRNAPRKVLAWWHERLAGSGKDNSRTKTACMAASNSSEMGPQPERPDAAQGQEVSLPLDKLPWGSHEQESAIVRF